jgi:uncharacterized protein
MNVNSPCNQVCKLDAFDVCIGCGRTRDEIARWMRMRDQEKFEVVSSLAARRQRFSSPSPRPSPQGEGEAIAPLPYTIEVSRNAEIHLKDGNQ